MTKELVALAESAFNEAGHVAGKKTRKKLASYVYVNHYVGEPTKNFEDVIRSSVLSVQVPVDYELVEDCLPCGVDLCTCTDPQRAIPYAISVFSRRLAGILENAMYTKMKGTGNYDFFVRVIEVTVGEPGERGQKKVSMVYIPFITKSRRKLIKEQEHEVSHQ